MVRVGSPTIRCGLLFFEKGEEKGLMTKFGRLVAGAFLGVLFLQGLCHSAVRAEATYALDVFL